MNIYANGIKNNSVISSNGISAASAHIMGGSSGGGSINIFYRNNYSNEGNINVDGGNVNYSNNRGGPGGIGSISIGQLLNGTYTSTYTNY